MMSNRGQPKIGLRIIDGLEKDLFWSAIFQQVCSLKQWWTEKKDRNFGKAVKMKNRVGWFTLNDLYFEAAERFGIISKIGSLVINHTNEAI